MIHKLTIEQSESKLSLTYNNTLKYIASAFLFIVISSYFLYLILSILNSKKVNEQIELTIGVIFLFSVLFILIIYQTIYKGIKYSKDITIEVNGDEIKLNQKIIKKSNIISLVRYKVPTKYNIRNYIILQTINYKKEIIAIRLDNENSSTILNSLEILIGKKSQTAERFFEFFVI